MKKYRKNCAAILVLSMLAFVGCGAAKVPSVVNTTSIAVTEKGTVTSYLVDVFDKDYYNISDLTAMAIDEAAAYNTEYQVGETIPLVVEKVEVLADGSDKVLVKHKYDTTDTFMNYNGSVLFYGTVTEAAEAGYNLSMTLKNVKDNTLFTEAQIMQKPEQHLLITNEKAAIYCPKKVTHISDGAIYNDDGSVDTSQADGLVMILMK